MTPVKNKYILFFGIAALVIAADQYTKYLIVKIMGNHVMHVVIPHFFNIVHVQNPGGAFGVFAGQSATFRAVVFIFITLFAIGLIVYLQVKTPATYRLFSVGLALIFGGAIGNIIDRIHSGRVTDFLDVCIGNYHWPAFNIADSAITIGMIIFAYYILFRKLPE